jgi:hypothetical protein
MQEMLQEMKDDIRTNRKEMNASQDGCLDGRNEGLVKRDDGLPRSDGGLSESKEPASLEVESNAVHDKVPKEVATMKTFGALKKQHGDQHLAVGWRRKGPSVMVGAKISWPPPTEG